MRREGNTSLNIIVNRAKHLTNNDMPSPVYPSQKVAVIGAGAVGATLAYPVVVKNLASEVVLIDANEQKEEGEVMDIADALCYVGTGTVRRGDLPDATDADIIVITAGVAQKPDETRLALMQRNAEIIKSIFKGIGKIRRESIVLMITNPVDALTYLAQEISGLPHNQVFGSGTSLDTARLKHKIAEYLKIDAHNIHGYVLGEHGDSEFVAWSTVVAGEAPIAKLIKSKKVLDKIAEQVKREAYEIIKRKGATCYGIAMDAAVIIEAILFNQHKILPLSTRADKWNGVSGVTLGLPAVVGRSGIERVWPLKLNAAERAALKRSAETIKKFIA